MDLAPAGSIRHILRVRWLGFVVVFAVGGVAHAGPLSNPAFLGIKMVDGRPGCVVESVTKGSAAQDAGLRSGDLIAAMDSVPTLDCTQLKLQILEHPPGDNVRIDVRRAIDHVVLKVSLSTRAEVLHRRFVGHAMEATELTDVDDAKRSYDLADRRGRTTVVGWFTKQCVGCAPVFDRVADGLAKRSGTSPFVLAVTQRPAQDDLSLLRKSFPTSIALAAADNATFEDLAIDDPERIHFMVIDCRGVVRFVAPVAPDSDDLDAAVDEVLAAAEQAEHARVSRR